MSQETISFDACLGLTWSLYEVLHYFESPKEKEVFGCLMNNLCKASDSKKALRIHLADQTWSKYYGDYFSKARFEKQMEWFERNDVASLQRGNSITKTCSIITPKMNVNSLLPFLAPSFKDFFKDTDIVLCYKINSKDGELAKLTKKELNPYVAELKLLNKQLENHQVSFKSILLNPEQSNFNLSTLPISIYSANKCSRCCPEQDNIEIPSSWIIYSRIFCRGDLEHGGRFNARIQSFPRKWRRNIWIDGQPTVEYDIKGCQPRMLHQLHGEDYRDDPYMVEANYTGEQREIAKIAMQYLLNEPVEQRARWGIRALTKQTDKTGEVFYTDYYLPEKLIAKHQSIANQFYGDVGVKLQRIESDIAYRVKIDMLSLGYGIVGIHDSFIVPESAQDILYQSVMDRYFERVGFYPVIKQEY